MSFIVTDCTADLVAKIQLVPTFAGKVLPVYSDDDLLDQKFIIPPLAGVMYEGLVAGPGDPSRQGLSVDLRLAVAVCFTPRTIGGADTQNEAALLLDGLRNQIARTTSPSGHKWRFVSELSLGKVRNVMVYVQRWATMVPLT